MESRGFPRFSVRPRRVLATRMQHDFGPRRRHWPPAAIFGTCRPVSLRLSRVRTPHLRQPFGNERRAIAGRAKNLGHTDTRMVEKHYGHLSENYVAEAIQKGGTEVRHRRADRECSARAEGTDVIPSDSGSETSDISDGGRRDRRIRCPPQHPGERSAVSRPSRALQERSFSNTFRSHLRGRLRLWCVSLPTKARIRRAGHASQDR